VGSQFLAILAIPAILAILETSFIVFCSLCKHALPRELAPLALQNKKVIYDLLFRTSAETLLEVARDPKHLGAQIGFFSVLHTWNQKLQHHPHVHCVCPPEVCPQITAAGSNPAPLSFFLSKY
jgi:hypothetical protein